MEHIKASLDSLARTLLRAIPEEERVLAAWRQVCGAQAAEHAHAETFSGGKLHLRVDDPAWLATLTQMRGQYCARLRDLTGVPVDELIFDSASPRRRG